MRWATGHTRRLWAVFADALRSTAKLELPRGARRMLGREPPLPRGPATLDDLEWSQARAWDAVTALRRWRGEPLDEDALAEGLEALEEAVGPVRGSEPAVRALATVVGHAALFNPEDARVVFSRRFDAFRQTHLPGLPAPTSTGIARLPSPATLAARAPPRLPVPASAMVRQSLVAALPTPAKPKPPVPALDLDAADPLPGPGAGPGRLVPGQRGARGPGPRAARMGP